MNIIRYFKRYLALRRISHIDNVHVAWWEPNGRVFNRLYVARMRALEEKMIRPRNTPLPVKMRKVAPVQFDSGVQRRCK